MPINKSLLLTFFALIVGLVAAFSSHLFLYTVETVTELRTDYPLLIWTLPLTGLFMTVAIKKLPVNINWGVSQLILELRQPKQKANPFLSLWIFINASLSHLGGASVGREGVGLIMSGSLIDGINPFKTDSRERSILLQAAMSAGFTGMFDTPLAAIFFIFEINEFRFIRDFKRIFIIALSSGATYFFSHYLNTPHVIYPDYYQSSWTGLFYLSLAVPLAAYVFYYSYRSFHRYSKMLGPFSLCWGGVLIGVLIHLFGTRYCGLGANLIEEAILGGQIYTWDFLAKSLLTALAIGIGFKGGEVTPLFFVGATLGAVIGQWTHDPDLAKIGMVAVLGSLTHTPISAGILALELFGPGALPWAMLISYWGKFLLRDRHLYRFS